MCIVEVVTGLIKMHRHLKLGYIKTVSTETPPPFCTSYLLYFLCLGISPHISYITSAIPILKAAMWGIF